MPIGIGLSTDMNKIRVVMIIVATLFFAALAGCDTGELPKVTPARVLPELGLELVAEPNRLVVSLRNNSNRSVEVSAETLLGYGASNDRIELEVRKGGKLIPPCMHMDPPFHRAPAMVVSPGQVITRDVEINLFRRVYCLDPIEYNVSALYESIDGTTARSNELILTGESK